MPVYMLQAAYTSEAWATMARRPENRGELVSAQIEKLGGRLLSRRIENFVLEGC